MKSFKSTSFSSFLILFLVIKTILSQTNVPADNPFDYANTNGTQITLLTQKDGFSWLSIDDKSPNKLVASLYALVSYSTDELKNLQGIGGIYFSFGIGSQMENSHIFLCAINLKFDAWCANYKGYKYGITQIGKLTDMTYSIKEAKLKGYKTEIIWNFTYNIDVKYLIYGNQPMIAAYGSLDLNEIPLKHGRSFYIKSGDGNFGNSTVIDSVDFGSPLKSRFITSINTILLIVALLSILL